jgi:hypothetical protein
MTDPEYPQPYRGRYVPPEPGPPGAPSGRPQVTLDAGRLWAGGVATAVVAALVAIVGLLIARVFDIKALRPLSGDTVFESPAARYAVLAAVAALVATGLMHLLILSAPRPQAFFTWIVLLATVAAGLLPFLRDASTESIVATALINVAIGICIGSLVSSVAARSTRVVR